MLRALRRAPQRDGLDGVGVGEGSDWEPVPLHSPAFDIDEAVLAIGARYFDRLVRRAHEQLHPLRSAA